MATETIASGSSGLVLELPEVGLMGPRIRTVKPEIWTSTDVLRLSILGRLVFVILITQADDEGRLKTNALHIAKVWLGGSVSAAEVEAQLALMERHRMVRRYRVGEDGFLGLVNWADHQVISHPTKSRHPAPPAAIERKSSRGLRKTPEDSRGLRKTLEASGASARVRADRIGPDRIGPDRIGPEGTGVSANASLELVLEPEVSRSPVEQVFDAWLASTSRSGRTVLDEKRRRLITRALKAYPLEDVLDAVDGWRFDAHHRGENDRNRPYNDLELVLRDPQHIERFRDFKRNPPPAVGLPASRGRAEQLGALYEREAVRIRQGRDS